MKKKETENVIFDNYEWDWDEERKHQIEFLLECGDYETEEDIPENELNDRIQWSINDWDDFAKELNKFLQNGEWLLVGSVERWTGRHGGYMRVRNADDIFNGFGKDCDYFKFTDVDGHLNVMCSHHDGRNYAELVRLTPKGLDFFENHDGERDCSTRIMSSNFLHGKAKYWKTVCA